MIIIDILGEDEEIIFKSSEDNDFNNKNLRKNEKELQTQLIEAI